MQKTKLSEKGANALAKLKALKDDKGAKYEFLESEIEFLKKAVKVANFKQIQKVIKSDFNQDISVSTIKRFCVDKGFYKPKAIAKKAKDSKLPAPNDKPKVEKSTTQNVVQNSQSDKSKVDLSSQINDNATASNADKGIIGKFFNK